MDEAKSLVDSAQALIADHPAADGALAMLDEAILRLSSVEEATVNKEEDTDMDTDDDEVEDVLREAFLARAFLRGLAGNELDLAHDDLVRALDCCGEDEGKAAEVQDMISELEEMRSEYNQEQEAERTGPLQSVDGLLEDGELTDAFANAIALVFRHFDKDKDSSWSNEEFDAFCVQVNGGPADAATKAFVEANLDTTPTGNLTHLGLVQLYASQAAGSADETWKDLAALGFDREWRTDGRYAAVQEQGLEQ